MKKFAMIVALAVTFGFTLVFAGCSNASDNSAALFEGYGTGGGAPVVSPTGTDGDNGGGTGATPSTTETDNGGGQASNPTEPIYKVKILGEEIKGIVIATPSEAAAGTEITLGVTTNTGYKFCSYTITCADASSFVIIEDKFTLPAQNVTVRANFEMDTQTRGGYAELPAGNDGTAGTNGAYVFFGLWPQTIKDASVTVDEDKKEKHGCFTYCRGCDGEWYVKKYDEWFKVEPIKWRVISEKNGKKNLLAESVLTTQAFYDNSWQMRDRGTLIIQPNNYYYSRIRSFLTGEGYFASTYKDESFYKTAFTNEQQVNIDSVGLAGLNDVESWDASLRIRNPTDFCKYKNPNTIGWWLATSKNQGLPPHQAEGMAYEVTANGGLVARTVGTDGVVPALCLPN